MFIVYGLFDASILEICESAEELNEAEKWNIAYFRSLGCRLTNMSLGGDGAAGRKFSDATKQKMSKAHIGKLKGIARPSEVRTRISKTKGGRAVVDGNGHIYESTAAAARSLGLSRASVSNVLRGRYSSVEGRYTFQYVYNQHECVGATGTDEQPS